MDARTQQLTSVLLMDKEQLDRSGVPELLEQTSAQISFVCADGGYDFEQRYRVLKEKEARALIPPPSDAVVRGRSPFEPMDESLRESKKLGRKAWKKESGYPKRSWPS